MQANPNNAPALTARAIVGFAAYSLLLPLLLFGAAGTLRWPMAWVYTVISLVVSLLSRVLLLRVHPDLAVERGRFTQAQDVKPWDRILMLIVGLVGPLVMIVVCGLDRRWGWSSLDAPWLQFAAVALMAAGYAFSVWALLANRFFSAVVRIQRDRGHTVVTGGPYRFVRHPGYAGGLVAYLVTPLLLGTLWGLLPALLTSALLIVRTALEDRMLRNELPGYADYARRVHFRLLPGVW